MFPTDPQTDVFWSMLEAIGTIAASVIALFSVLYFEIFRPARRKPLLEFHYKNINPYKHN